MFMFISKNMFIYMFIPVPMESEVSWSTKHFGSFTAKQWDSILN